MFKIPLAILPGLAVGLCPTLYAENTPMPKPVRIYEGLKSQTKTYMHQFVDSPDGTKYAFRYFPGGNQPLGAKGKNAGGSPCEIWLCKSDLTGHRKAFTSPKSEGGHGSDVIVWVTDDLIYYAGLAYQISTGKIRWQFSGNDSDLPLARNYPVASDKLYVGIRGHGEPDGHSSSKGVGSRDKGWYWLDPSSPTKPELHLVSDMKPLVKYYGGSWESAEATYIHQNPSDTKLHVVVYDRSKRQEFAFILNAGDGSVHSYLGPNGVGRCHNGHVLWLDDETLMAGNQHPGLFDLDGKLLNGLQAGVREITSRSLQISSGGWRIPTGNRMSDSTRWVLASLLSSAAMSNIATTTRLFPEMASTCSSKGRNQVSPIWAYIVSMFRVLQGRRPWLKNHSPLAYAVH